MERVSIGKGFMNALLMRIKMLLKFPKFDFPLNSPQNFWILLRPLLPKASLTNPSTTDSPAPS
jgi:hypothetical protein